VHHQSSHYTRCIKTYFHRISVWTDRVKAVARFSRQHVAFLCAEHSWLWQNVPEFSLCNVEQREARESNDRNYRRKIFDHSFVVGHCHLILLMLASLAIRSTCKLVSSHIGSEFGFAAALYCWIRYTVSPCHWLRLVKLRLHHRQGESTTDFFKNNNDKRMEYQPWQSDIIELKNMIYIYEISWLDEMWLRGIGGMCLESWGIFPF